MKKIILKNLLITALVLFVVPFYAQSGTNAANAIVVNTLPYSTTGNNLTSSGFSDTAGYSAAPDVWYKVMLNNTCTLSIDTCTGTDYDSYLYIYDSDGATILTYSDDSCGLSSAIYNFNVSGKPFVYVIVSGFSSAEGNYGLNISQVLSTTTAPTASAQSLSTGSTVASLVATGDAGATLNWYNVATGGTALASTTTLASGTYYVSQVVGGCEGPRTAVAVTLLPMSQINSSYCGTTLNSLYVTMGATWVTGSQGYRFKVTNMTTNTFQTVDRPVNNIALCNVPGTTLNTQYKIEVALKFNGVWQTTYGPACYVNTANPLPTVGAQCGTMLNAIGDWVYCNYFPNTSVYRFKVTNTTDNSVQIKDNPYNKFNFNQLPNRAYSTTYTVEVAVKNTDGTFLAYGSPCNITTPGLVTLTGNNTNTAMSKEGFIAFNAVAFPNPSSNYFNINVDTVSKSDIEVRVYDMLGKMIDNKIININANQSSAFEIGSQYTSGVYNVIISQDENIKTLRLVKQ